MNFSKSELNVIKKYLIEKINENPSEILPILSKIEEYNILTLSKSKSTFKELGYFGNLWVRQNYIPIKNTPIPGHSHHFDHVTLLVQGKVSVKVEGYESKVFTAPTFITIKKELHHEFTSLEDDTLYYCIFAMRDNDGNILDEYTEDHDPLSYGKKNDGSNFNPCGDCKGCDHTLFE